MEQVMSFDDTFILDRELDRAHLGHESRRTRRVTVGAKVAYLDLHSGVRHELTLVLPWDADPARAKVSILAPVGTALYGLRAGETVHFRSPRGREHDFRVLSVRAPR